MRIAAVMALGGGLSHAAPAGTDEEEAPPPSIVPGLTNRSSDAPLAAVFEKADPDKDPSWKSESFSKKAMSQLKALGAALAADDAPAREEFFSPAVEFDPLQPAVAEVYADGALTVLRESAAPASARAKGLAVLASAFQGWRGAFHPENAHLRTHWKIIRVDLEANEGPRTTAYLEVSGYAPDGSRLAQNSTWDCSWTADGTPPKLTSIGIRDFEEVRYKSHEPPFLDATAALFSRAPTYHEQLVFGADHWYGNLDVAFGIHQGNQGLALADVNGDGREDLFLCQPAGLPSRLYLQDDDGRLRDATTDAGLDWLDNSRSALFADLDNDGDQDLAVSLGYSLAIHENDGSGRFKFRVEVEIHSWPSSIAAADHDLDGDLDLYVCGYNPRGETAPGDIFANPVPYHDANNGARNFFLDNLGNFDFADITEPVGFNANNRRFTFAASWEDYDNDGDPDLYVANDFGRNSLYRNDVLPDGSRRFTDVAAEAGVEDIAAGMSVSWGDYDRDGLMDVYVSNMFSSAGNRIAYQAQFKPHTDGGTLASLRRHARGNSLFRNKGDGTFEDVSVEAGVTMGRWAWGSHFLDLNNDGWEDLFVANGFFTTEDTGDL